MAVCEFSYGGQDLKQWSVAHSAAFEIEAAGAGVFADAAADDWHLIRLAKLDFLHARLRVCVEFEPLQADGPFFYIHHWGQRDICKVDMAGNVVLRDPDAEVEVRRSESRVIVEAVFENAHISVSIGSATGSDVYPGTGRPLFRIHAIRIEVLDQRDMRASGWPLEERIRLVDVGGAGGMQPQWLEHFDKISPVLFEPNPAEAAKLGQAVSRFPGGAVVQKALSNITETRPLNIAEHWGCTSMLEPNYDLLSRYRIANIFKVKARENVECVRYDRLWREGLAPVPDVIKIDVQGFEYEVLLGFGGLLEHCVGIELEAHLYPIYRNQKLLGDLVALLDEFGLALRSVRPAPNFDGDLVEVDAFFTRRKSPALAADALMRRKLELVNNVWGLPQTLA